MRSLHVLFVTSSVLLLIACSSQPEAPHLEEFIVGKWQGGNKPYSMEFWRGGKIIWDMATHDKTLRFAGNYKFIDHNTIKVDFIRYSNKSTIWDISYSSSFPPQESITIRDCNADDVIATMERVY